jgi:hypothetical protein
LQRFFPFGSWQAQDQNREDHRVVGAQQAFENDKQCNRDKVGGVYHGTQDT